MKAKVKKKKDENLNFYYMKITKDNIKNVIRDENLLNNFYLFNVFHLYIIFIIFII